MADNVRHPAPVNQFNRLDYDEVARKYYKTTRWNHSHRNAAGVLTNWDSLLCMATEGAVAIDAHTGGRLRSTPGAIHDHQDDQMGGIGVDDVAVAWKRLWGADLIVPSDYDWADVMTAVRARRHVIVGVDYEDVPYEYQEQKGGTFDHALGVDDVRSDGSILRYDSLGANPRWVPQSAVRAGAESLALRVRGTRSRLFVALTAVRPKLNAPAPTYWATVIHATNLWNEETDVWVYNGANALTTIAGLQVRGAIYTKDGVKCYPVQAPAKFAGHYFIPVANVKLGGRVG